MIIRHDREDAAYLRYAAEFLSVCSLNMPSQSRGVGTLIHPQWILTAGHCVKRLTMGHELLFGNRPYAVQEVVCHPSWLTNTARPSRETIRNVADLALIKLREPVESIPPLGLDKLGASVGEVVTFVANGAAGNGLEGEKHWDYQWRAATNKVEEVLYDEWLMFRLDEPGEATELEGIGFGSSGSPALVQRGEEWLVTAVGSWSSAQTPEHRGKYGTCKYYVSVSHFADWVLETMSHYSP